VLPLYSICNWAILYTDSKLMGCKMVIF